MIRHHFGLNAHPFDPEGCQLLPAQREIFEILRAHCQQGGFCLVAGEPGCGKSVLREALQTHDPKRLVTATVGRTLHTYHNTVRLLCEAFQIDFDGGDVKCERRLIAEAWRLNHLGKMIAVLIDDAHLMDTHAMRKLRLLLADFPKNHNLVLFAQAELIGKIQLTVNEDIRSRLTYSALLRKLTDEDIRRFILDQFDRCGLAHNRISDDALALIARSSEGLLRNAAHLTLAALHHTVRDQQKTCGLAHVNSALMQPHWRRYEDLVSSPDAQ